MPNQFLSPEGDLEEYFVDEYWLIDQYVGDTLWTWGGNNQGQLGNGVTNTTANPNPSQVFGGGTNWKQVACGYLHTAAIKIDGTLWTWGLNSYGRLGDGTVIQRNIPTVISASATTWKQVAGGRFHTAAVKTDGTLWTWGRNNSGQLGDGTSGNISTTPAQTSAGATTWKQVACGYAHTAAIKIDGTLWAWGQNAYRQLGDNTNVQRTSPVQISIGATNWKQVACGDYHTVAIKTDGTLFAWGSNSQGQIGDGTLGINRTIPTQISVGTTNWKQVACGQYHTAAIKTDGTLWTWGRNNEGQLGINLSGAGNDRSTPVTTFAGGTNWKQVACGLYNTIAVKTDGTVWGWGRNDLGQVGINNTTDPISIPTKIYGAGTNWKQVACGFYHTTAVTSGTDATYFIS
jgi:alpha-tubulin suppressor-like RCC1 family protein